MCHRFGMAGMDLDTFDEQFFMSIKYLFSKIFCLVFFHNLLNDIIQYSFKSLSLLNTKWVKDHTSNN